MWYDNKEIYQFIDIWRNAFELQKVSDIELTLKPIEEEYIKIGYLKYCELKEIDIEAKEILEEYIKENNIYNNEQIELIEEFKKELKKNGI